MTHTDNGDEQRRSMALLTRHTCRDVDGVLTTLNASLSFEELDALINCNLRLRRLRHNGYEIPVRETRLARDYFTAWQMVFTDPEVSPLQMWRAARFLGANLARWYILFGWPLRVPFQCVQVLPEPLLKRPVYRWLMLWGFTGCIRAHYAELTARERLVGAEILAHVHCQVASCVSQVPDKRTAPGSVTAVLGRALVSRHPIH
jgi:hypothetical protein